MGNVSTAYWNFFDAFRVTEEHDIDFPTNLRSKVGLNVIRVTFFYADIFLMIPIIPLGFLLLP